MNSLANITANGATLENKTGNVLLATRTRGDNQPDAKLQVFTGFTGAGAAKVRAQTNAVNSIDLNNSIIKGVRVDVLAGKFVNDNSGTGNIFDNYAYASVKTASFLPSAALDSVTSILNENNIVNLTGSTRISALSDAEVTARQGISLSEEAGNVVSLSVVPMVTVSTTMRFSIKTTR